MAEDKKANVPVISDDESQKPSKKRARKSSDDASSKKRGRPRVDTQDETAADRRRTQIRLAQRAYRQRKETTISSLKKRVNELQSAVDTMNTAFLDFNDTVTTSDHTHLSPQLSSQLQNTLQLFLKLAKETAQNAVTGDEEDGLEADDQAPVADAKPNDEASGSFSVPQTPISATHSQSMLPPPQPAQHTQHTQQQLQEYQPAYAPPSNEHDHLDMGWGYQRMMGHYDQGTQARDTVSTYLSQLPTSQSPSESPYLPFGMLPDPSHDHVHHYQVNRATMPSPPVDPWATLSVPSTYSFQETTFGRRLKRRAAELAFHLLVTTDPSQSTLAKRVFQLPMMTHTYEQIAAKFKRILRATNTESLDDWQWPFLHIGGAGTHYPVRDAFLNIVPIPNAWTVRRIGPTPRRVRLQNSTGTIQEMDMDLTSFDGEFFDATDVQGYLESKGIYIDAQSSYADVVVDQPRPTHPPGSMGSPLGMDVAFSKPSYLPPNLTHRAPGEVSATPTESTASLTYASTVSGHDSSVPQTPVQMATGGPDFSDTASFAQPLDVPGEIGSLSKRNSFDQFSHPQLKYESNFQLGESVVTYPAVSMHHKVPAGKRLVTIDVTKFVDDLVKNAVCLGRAPGFRRWHVDQTLTGSIITTTC